MRTMSPPNKASRHTVRPVSPSPSNQENQSPSEIRLHDGSYVQEPLLSRRAMSDSAATPTVSPTKACFLEDDASVHVLALNKEFILNSTCRRMMYSLCQLFFRSLPACILYGGTIALFANTGTYQWGTLFCLTLYTIYIFLCTAHMSFWGAVGVWKLWLHGSVDWRRKHHREQPEPTSPGNNRGCDHLEWEDIIHIVMIPNYKTPYPVLCATIDCLMQFGASRSSMGIVLAMEETEDEARRKAQDLISDYKEQFLFIWPTFHPPNLPNHVPGKSANECWAFSQLQDRLAEELHIVKDDPRVIITVIDDDSEMHEHYFDALNYHYLKAPEKGRYLMLWQPPIVHFKNYLQQPGIVRMASVITSIHELACLADPMDFHVPFSSYSLSLRLASAVDGWDPDYISEDWHMMAKCSLKTEGRVRCQPIYLPLINYAPEEDTWLGTLKSRWTQACRHSLGVSEVVYVLNTLFLAFFDLPTFSRFLAMVGRILPLLGKFSSTHLQVGTLAFWPALSHWIVRYYVWSDSWCHEEILSTTSRNPQLAMAATKMQTLCHDVAASRLGLENEQVILNSWTVHIQQKANLCIVLCLLLTSGIGMFLFNHVRDRVSGDVREKIVESNLILHWIRSQVDFFIWGWISSVFFASIPEWIAALRLMKTMRFEHKVAGMVGRTEDVTNVPTFRDKM